MTFDPVILLHPFPKILVIGAEDFQSDQAQVTFGKIFRCGSKPGNVVRTQAGPVDDDSRSVKVIAHLIQDIGKLNRRTGKELPAPQEDTERPPSR